MSLAERLGQFGITSTEAELYLKLAEIGRSSAHALAKRCGLPRTTTYSVLDSLVRKGFAAVDKGKTVSVYIANDPSVLLRQVEREKEEISRKEIEAAALVELVRPSFRSEFYHVPKTKFYEGREGVEQMLYENLVLWQTSMAQYDSTWWGYQDHTFVEHFLPFLEHSWEHRSPDEKIYLVSNVSTVEDQLRGRKIRSREIRSIPVLLEFSSTIWILGDYILLIMTRNEPFYSFQIHDPVFAANLRSVFQLLWGLEQPKKSKSVNPKRLRNSNEIAG